MSPISRLISSKPSSAAPAKELSEEDLEAIEANEKAQRIQYHREHVRNGPVNPRWQSAGQARRQAARDRKSAQKKATRANKASWFAEQRAKAITLGHLKTLGVLPYSTAYQPGEHAKIDAAQAIVRRFGERDDDGALVLHEDILTEASKAAVEFVTGKAAA